MEDTYNSYNPLKDPPKRRPLGIPILDGLDNEEFKPFIRREEEPIPHLYLDSKKNVTTGVGLHLPTVKDAQKIPFRYDSKDGRPATIAEIGAAYEKVKSFPYQNHTATHFNPEGNRLFDRVFLDRETMERMFDNRLRTHAGELRTKFPNFEEMEAPARKALLDMHYNIGNARFSDYYYDAQKGKTVPGWPKLFDAINQRDWARAAGESHRKDVGEERNKQIHTWFMDADALRRGR